MCDKELFSCAVNKIIQPSNQCFIWRTFACVCACLCSCIVCVHVMHLCACMCILIFLLLFLWGGGLGGGGGGVVCVCVVVAVVVFGGVLFSCVCLCFCFFCFSPFTLTVALCRLHTWEWHDVGCPGFSQQCAGPAQWAGSGLPSYTLSVESAQSEQEVFCFFSHASGKAAGQLQPVQD